MKILFKVLLTSVLQYSSVVSDEPKQNPFLLNFQQNDYQLIPERADISNVNRDYMEDATVKTFKYNRTCTAFNGTLTFKVDVGNETEVILQAYKFSSNEYRLFPMRFEVNLCQCLSANILGLAKIDKCGNFTGCPLKKMQKYIICNFIPDPSKFPPFIPSGRYMWQMQALYRSVEIFVANTYAEISRPFTGK